MFSRSLCPLPKLMLAAAAAALLAVAPTPSSAQDDEVPGAARLAYVAGTVSIEPAGVDSWGQATPNLPLGPGDRIFTDADGQAEIQVGESFVRLGPNTDLTFTRDTPSSIAFYLLTGHIHVHEFGLWPGQPFQIHTPGANGTITNAQPAEFRVVVPSREDPNGFFTSFSGNLEVNSDSGFDQILPLGQTLEMVGVPGNPQPLPEAGPDRIDNWSMERDQMYARSSSLRYVSPHIPGAYELDGAGDWQPASDYGPVWFPRVQAGWQPYRNGRWVNHAPWGWMWVEDEPWGYAPFHYGRWVTMNGRWGWIPGPVEARPIFSPALVVFAGGINVGGVAVSAWFPLGPGEPYRPWYPCSPHYIDEVNISNIRPAPRVHVEVSYVNIVKITNVTNITYVNRTVGVTAMSHDDFASGRVAAKVEVKVDPKQMEHMTPLAKPVPKPTEASFVGHPPAKPVPVKATRPPMTESKSAAKAVEAAKTGQSPKPQPAAAEPMEKPVPAAKTMDKSMDKTAPAVKPGEKPAPATKPEARPMDTEKPASKPETKAPPKPADKTAKPEARSEAKPADKTAPKPADKKKTDKTKPEDQKPE